METIVSQIFLAVAQQSYRAYGTFCCGVVSSSIIDDTFHYLKGESSRGKFLNHNSRNCMMCYGSTKPYPSTKYVTCEHCLSCVGSHLTAITFITCARCYINIHTNDELFEKTDNQKLHNHNSFPILRDAMYVMSKCANKLLERRYATISQIFIMSSYDNTSTIFTLPHDVIMYIAIFIYK